MHDSLIFGQLAAGLNTSSVRGDVVTQLFNISALVMMKNALQVRHGCVIASEGLPSLIALLTMFSDPLLLLHYTDTLFLIIPRMQQLKQYSTMRKCSIPYSRYYGPS